MKKILLGIGLLLFLGSGTLYYTNNYKSYSRMILITGIILIFLVEGKALLKFHISSGLFSMRKLYYIFSFSILLSLLNSQEMGIVISAVGMVLIGLTTFNWAPDAMARYRLGYVQVLVMLALFQIIVFVSGFISKGVNTSRYEGIFRNSNSFGSTAATLCTIILMIYLYSLQESNVTLIGTILFVALLGLPICCSIISNCRTSFVVILISLIFFALIVVKYLASRDSRKRKTAFSILLLVCISLTVTLAFTDIYKIFQENIIAKFDSYAESNDMFNGRQERWMDILKRCRFFGNGEYADLGAHNTFLSMLDQYGIIPFISLSLFTLLGLLKSVKKVLFSKDVKGLDYIPLFSFIAFGVNGITEGMMLSTAMILAVFSAHILEPQKMREGT